MIPAGSIRPRSFRASRPATVKRGWCALLGAISVSIAGAQESSGPMPLEEKNHSTAEIVSVFSAVPPSGCAPLRVLLTNKTENDLTINVETISSSGGFSASHQVRSSFAFTAQKQATAVKDFIVPLAADMDSGSWGNGSLVVSMAAAGARNVSKSFSVKAPSDHLFTAFSKTLVPKGTREMDVYADNSTGRGTHYSLNGFAVHFEPATLPVEWRGYAGLDALAMTVNDWTGLAPAAKTAILQWTALGGMLDLYVAQPSSTSLASHGIKTDGQTGGHSTCGLGTVRLVKGEAPLPQETAAEYQASAHPGEFAPQRHTFLRNALTLGGEPPLLSSLGVKSFAAWQVGVILLVFGIVVGPVNLFYLAGQGRRHRLFFTTPVIALAASAVLLVVILFQDGIGGDGRRAAAVYVSAADSTAFVYQQQVSRTGVLMGGSFTLPDAALVEAALLPESRWTRLKSGSGRSVEAQRYSVDSGKSFAGDYFQSRSEQAQIVQSVRSTRGRLELASTTPAPALRSTFEATLDSVFYRDADGKYWSGSDKLTTGSTVTLQPSDAAAFQKWLRTASARLTPALNSRLGLAEALNFFYAVSSDAKAGLVDTLDSIDWKDDAVLLYGPVAQ